MLISVRDQYCKPLLRTLLGMLEDPRTITTYFKRAPMHEPFYGQSFNGRLRVKGRERADEMPCEAFCGRIQFVNLVHAEGKLEKAKKYMFEGNLCELMERKGVSETRERDKRPWASQNSDKERGERELVCA